MSDPAVGRLAVVGLGPGDAAWRTPEASTRVAAATDLVGYGPYLRQVGEIGEHQTAHSFPNRREAARAAFALDLAASGRDVVIVSSGDPGIFAMATAVVEELHREKASDRWAGVTVTVVPGVTAATAAAARIGAPLGHDLCLISLSDVLKPWGVIERRISAAAMADFVIALYNPLSRHRPWQLQRALELIGQHRSADTPVVEAHNVGRPEESIRSLALGEVTSDTVDMRTLLIVGSSTTQQFTDRGGRSWVYTPRHYPAAPTDAAG
jgi:cobalt-precorrin 5A hydrolase / precorrin-3B C17-methyltransferase